MTIVATVGRPGRDLGTTGGRDIAHQLVAGTGPDAAHRLGQIDQALRGERVTFVAAVGGRRVACTAEPLSVAGGAATHVLIMVEDTVPPDLLVPDDPGAALKLLDGPALLRDRGRHLDDGDYDVLTELAAGRTSGRHRHRAAAHLPRPTPPDRPALLHHATPVRGASTQVLHAARAAGHHALDRAAHRVLVVDDGHGQPAQATSRQLADTRVTYCVIHA